MTTPPPYDDRAELIERIEQQREGLNDYLQQVESLLSRLRKAEEYAYAAYMMAAVGRDVLAEDAAEAAKPKRGRK